MKQKELVIDHLMAMGFEISEMDGVIHFQYEELNYLYIPDDDDEQFLRIAVPHLFEVTDENRSAVFDAMHETTLMIKYSKVCILCENAVWAIYEHRLNSTGNLSELLEHIIRVLEVTAHVFYKKILGDEVEGRAEDTEELSDEEVETELQRILDSIKEEEEANENR